jgi:hypothetical protein
LDHVPGLLGCEKKSVLKAGRIHEKQPEKAGGTEKIK